MERALSRMRGVDADLHAMVIRSLGGDPSAFAGRDNRGEYLDPQSSRARLGMIVARAEQEQRRRETGAED